MRTLPRFSAVLPVLLTAPAFQAHATVQVVGSVSSSVTVFSPYQNSTDSPIFNVNTPAQAMVPHSVSGSASIPGQGVSQGTATGSIGTLKAYSYTQWQSGVYNPFNYATTEAKLYAYDQLTVTGPQPNGTATAIAFTLDISGTQPAPDFVVGGSYNAQANAVFIICGGTCLNLKYTSLSAQANTNLLSGVLNTTIGAVLNLTYTLSALTYVTAASPYSTAAVDYLHTAHFHADALDPDVTLVSQSGYDYATPSGTAPEPASPALMAAGLAGFGVRRRLASGASV